jgi:hypothetical protein
MAKSQIGCSREVIVKRTPIQIIRKIPLDQSCGEIISPNFEVENHQKMSNIGFIQFEIDTSHSHTLKYSTFT